MGDLSAGVPTLASRLRELRVGQPEGVSMTQGQLADLMGVSTALLSSWENGKATPSEGRLRDYARCFCSPRSLELGRLLEDSELRPEEEAERRRLIDHLDALRDASRGRALDAGSLGGRFWSFPVGHRVVIVYNSLPSLSALEYAQGENPNYIESLNNADIDATLELFGHLRAENPHNEIRIRPLSELSARNMTGSHLVFLGGMPSEAETLGWFWRRLELPVHARLPQGSDELYDFEFVVTTGDDGEPRYQGNGK
jgi:transcriptional regulator with XRE-family HTH domain